LVELVVVMAIMVVVIGIVAPSFKNFLQGRNLSNEAQQFLSSTRYAMARAVGESVPVDLWLNQKQEKYGLGASGGYSETMTNGTWFSLDQDVKMTVYQSRTTMTRSNSWTLATGRQNRLPVIRFQPDGFISDSSPSRVIFKQGLTEIWIVENANHRRYEVQINHPRSTRN
jgi:Tfp pilus assembly protein FimT